VVKKFLCSPTGKLVLFRAGKKGDSDAKKWYCTSVTPLPVQVGSLTATSPIRLLAETTFNHRAKLNSLKEAA